MRGWRRPSCPARTLATTTPPLQQPRVRHTTSSASAPAATRCSETRAWDKYLKTAVWSRAPHCISLSVRPDLTPTRLVICADAASGRRLLIAIVFPTAGLSITLYKLLTVTLSSPYTGSCGLPCCSFNWDLRVASRHSRARQEAGPSVPGCRGIVGCQALVVSRVWLLPSLH